jgi:hypothetical protein
LTNINLEVLEKICHLLTNVDLSFILSPIKSKIYIYIYHGILNYNIFSTSIKTTNSSGLVYRDYVEKNLSNALMIL